MEVFDRRRLKLIEMLQGITAAELSRKSGVSPSYISRCLKTPDEDGYKTIGEVTARKLEVGARKPEGWLDDNPNTANITLPAFQMSGSGGPTAIELENNPLYPAIRRVKLKAQAGVSGYAVEYSTEDDGPPIVFRADWYKAKGYKPEKMLALRVTGESMIPSMYEGDLIVINTLSTTPKQGIPFLASYEGEIVVKRLVRDDEMWWLTSDNPDQRRYPRTKCNGGTEIIGEVVYRQTERV